MATQLPKGKIASAATKVEGEEEAVTETPTPAPAPAVKEPAPAPAPVQEPQAASPGEVMRLGLDAGMPPAAVEAMVNEKLSLDAVKARVETAKTIRAKVDLARRINPAIDKKFGDDLIVAGASVEHAGAALLEKVCAMQAAPTVAHHDGGTVSADHGWGKVIDKVNASR